MKSVIDEVRKRLTWIKMYEETGMQGLHVVNVEFLAQPLENGIDDINNMEKQVGQQEP
jgi:hypothetical protein